MHYKCAVNIKYVFRVKGKASQTCKRAQMRWRLTAVCVSAKKWRSVRETRNRHTNCSYMIKQHFSPHPLSQILPLPIENISGKKMQMALIKNWRGEISLTEGLPAGSTSSVVHRRSGEQKQDVKMYKQQKTYILCTGQVLGLVLHLINTNSFLLRSTKHSVYLSLSVWVSFSAHTGLNFLKV